MADSKTSKVSRRIYVLTCDVRQLFQTNPRLRDPFDGAPLRYRRLEKSYVIYSVGQDGHDDGGREKPADWNPADKTTSDITFTVER